MAEVTYYYDVIVYSQWIDPTNMVDGILTNYASTSSDGAKAELDSTTCPGTDLGEITKVEIRFYGYGDGDDRIDIAFDSDMEIQYPFTMPSSPGWSIYQDVTDDPFVGGWTWAKVQNLEPYELFVEFDKVAKGNTMYCAKVEIRVTYTPVGAVETIVAKEFPMSYLESPVKAKELRSKVSGATITIVSMDFPLSSLKSGKAKELKSKWS